MASGDHQAKLLHTYDPMKLAAAEALWESESPAGFSLFAIGDVEGSRNLVNVQVPYVLSFLATGDVTGEVAGHRRHPGGASSSGSAPATTCRTCPSCTGPSGS
jgi:cytochrome bd-type quinol oxidase subunit 1